MSHRIIISSIAAPAAALTASHDNTQSSVIYELAFTPSHDLPDNVVNQRIAKARRALAKLETDLTAPAAASED